MWKWAFLVVLLSIIGYFVQNYLQDDGPQQIYAEGLFSVDQLSQYNGVIKPQIYLAILGQIFDVTKGEKHYGLGGPYHYFVGRDASPSFITGNQENLSDDVSNLTSKDLLSLFNWLDFYKKNYEFVGKLVGTYYNEKGDLSDFAQKTYHFVELAEKAKEAKAEFDKQYPQCNVEWNPDEGTKFWCSNQSGGIERDWVGVPRKYFEPGSKTHRCVCVQLHTIKNQGNFQEFEDCEPNSITCFDN